MSRKLQMRNSILLLFFVCVSGNLLAQNNPEYPHYSVDLTKTNEYLAEIYLNCPEYTTQEHLERANELLSRIVFHEVPLSEYPECPLLSSALKKNKCNPGLDFSLDQFIPESFNPLKYFLKYSDTESHYYRVDGKNYIIEVKPRQ